MNKNNIRNFCIIAHIDHGKSTLSDRLLELTNTIKKEKMMEQFLDQNPISRERGITIKLAPVRMNCQSGGEDYVLNLIDTPGHVDFSYEVSRTLAACEGAVLLVDATQNIQAQTVAHFNAAKKENLSIIPVINKIDLPNADPENVANTLVDTLGFKKEEIIYLSAKSGENVGNLLERIIEKLPPPAGHLESHLRALIFDAVYDQHRGVIAFVKIVDGKVKTGERIKFLQNDVKTIAGEVGHFSPFLVPQKELIAGEIGYIVTGIKDIHDCNVGDTITSDNSNINPLPGYKQPKPMIFFGVYPKNTNELIHLKEALSKLALTDASLSISEEYSAFLGSGFRVGFLGLLHADIVKERLREEGGVEPLLTMPQVLYKKEEDGIIFEPYIKLLIYTPNEFVGSIIPIAQRRKGQLKNMYYHEKYAVLEYEMPYSMFIRGISSEIKSASSGYASIDYEQLDYRKADLVNLEIRVNDNPIDILSELIYKEEALAVAREKTERLKNTLDKQQFRQVIQGLVDGKIIAREEISPFRKDVLQKMSGGDRTRKDKLLKKQKKGKSRMLSNAKINLSQEALFSFLEHS